MVALLNFISIVGLLVVLVLFITYVPKFIRSYRLSKIAKKFGLSFEVGKMFYFIAPNEVKRNVIKGIINGHHVELYDSLITYATKVPLITFWGSYLPKRNTVLIVDNKKEYISQWLRWYGWYASISKIKKILKNIN